MAEQPTGRTTRYVSPDGLLAFLIIRYPNDVALGFDGVPSHTHGDILASLSGLPEEAIEQYTGALLGSRSVIAIHCVDGPSEGRLDRR